jgi:putative zinc finger/helix-turn-helix YgiT family protein
MQQQKDCPFCGSSSKLKSQLTDKEFRKEKFRTREFFYKCGACHEEFTTTDLDEVTVNQVYNQYREKHGILFPEELIYLRNQYQLSAQKMALVLGLGINTYSNYEKGEMPTMASNNLINSAKTPEVFLSYVNQAKDEFTDKSFRELTKHIDRLIQDAAKKNDLALFYINKYQRPNEYTGYSLPDVNKMANLLLYLITSCNPDYNDKLKLNKLLFYSDYYHYQQTGKSITGLTYRAIPYGPVPVNYDYLFAYLTNDLKLIEPTFSESLNSKVIEYFSVKKSFDLSVFDQEELQTIKKIIEKFRNTNSWELVELSHKEKAWIELNKNSGIISYQEYGFDLKAI